MLTAMTAITDKVFSIEGKSLKLNTAQDVAVYVQELASCTDLTEIRLSGNTIGVEAARALAGALKDKSQLRVPPPCSYTQLCHRWPV